MREAPANSQVSVTAKGSHTSVQKSRGTRLGISLRQRQPHGPILITDIDETGLFGSLNSNRKGYLQVGQQVVAINGMPSPHLVIEVVQLMNDTIGKLTIVSADAEPEETTASASVLASSESLSLSLLVNDGGRRYYCDRTKSSTE